MPDSLRMNTSDLPERQFEIFWDKYSLLEEIKIHMQSKICTYREQMEPFPGGNQLEAAAAPRRIMDADVDPAMQQHHSYPPEISFCFEEII